MPNSLTPDKVLPIGGGYKLVERLGAGTFGEVWEAEAPGGKLVALKILRWPIDHPVRQRESDSLVLIKQLNHTYLLDIHAIHSLDDSLIIVTRKADGNLQERLKEHKKQGSKGIPPVELLQYMKEAAEVLDYLHNQDIQHRDIKPENLLVSQGHIVVGDLGLARFMAGVQTNASVLGTPPYMPPEVWLGSIHQNSDQYSLAVTYAELRRGRRPFKTANFSGLLREHLEPTDQTESLQDEEIDVLLKAGAKDPNERYSSCQEFAEALHQAVHAGKTGEPGSTLKNTWKGERREKKKRRAAPTVSLVAAVLLLFLVTGIAIPTWFPGFFENQEDPVNPQFIRKDARDKSVESDKRQNPKHRKSDDVAHLLRQVVYKDFDLKVEMLGGIADGRNPIQLVMGETVEFRIKVSCDAYVGIWTVDAAENITQLFPNKFDATYFVSKGETRNVPNNPEYEIVATVPNGLENVWIAASTRRWDKLHGNYEGPYLVFKTKEEKLRFTETVRGLRTMAVEKRAAVAEQFLTFTVLPQKRQE